RDPPPRRAVDADDARAAPARRGGRRRRAAPGDALRRDAFGVLRPGAPGRAVERPLLRQRASSLTIAAVPTATITPRKTGAGRRRPTSAPIWPPSADPAASSPATAQLTCCAARTKTTPAIRFVIAARTFFSPLMR